MLIKEDYKSWKATDLAPTGGKPLLIDQADYLTHHIFFDDNAGAQPGSCVDVRDLVTGRSLDWKKVENMYVVKVEPHRAILEFDYFIKSIE